MNAIINSGPREDSTRIGRAGTVRRQAVDVSPLRRVNQVIFLNGLIVLDVLSEARVTSGYCPLSWCARALVEELLFVYSLAVASCGPVNHRLRDIVTAQCAPHTGSLQCLTFFCLLVLGHLAAVHRSKRSCFQEHQDHCRVPG